MENCFILKLDRVEINKKTW